MPVQVALLRGINVGKAKRIAMADLRALLGDLGHGDVSTILMSGNAVFRSSARDTDVLAAGIEAAIKNRLSMDVRVIVRTAAEVRKAADANPFADRSGAAPNRLGLSFLESDPDAKSLAPIVDKDWSPEAFAVGDRVLYAWQPNGITGSKLGEALLKVKGLPLHTARNLATVEKILERAEHAA
ncbi:MAG TPA: DUF1697 domain-containing protein [Acidimicrobiales bacterium]|nr:DUF1697 domain-containing protein [Acidimicrobiales bacterium]